MKKILSMVMTTVMVLGLSVNVFAEQTVPKDADVTLTIAQVVDVDALTVGQTIPLEVTALKKGSACTAVWSVSRLNTDGSTDLTANCTILGDATASVVTDSSLVDNWVAGGTFTGNVAGTYQITATLTMSAGKSDVSWNGSDSTNVTVLNPATVTGFVAKNFVATAVWNSKHTNITGYNVEYDLFINYSDNTSEKYNSLTNAMGAGQKSDSLTVLYTDGKTYSYTVTNPVNK